MDRRKELTGELIVAVPLDVLEGGSEPDPLSETNELLANSKRLEGVEIDSASVLVLALPEAVRAPSSTRLRAFSRDVLYAL